MGEGIAGVQMGMEICLPQCAPLPPFKRFAVHALKSVCCQAQTMAQDLAFPLALA